jgi:hypothetical protein
MKVTLCCDNTGWHISRLHLGDPLLSSCPVQISVSKTKKSSQLGPWCGRRRKDDGDPSLSKIFWETGSFNFSSPSSFHHRRVWGEIYKEKVYSLFCFDVLCFFFFWIRVSVAQGGLKFMIPLLLPPKCWDYRCVLPYLAQSFLIRIKFIILLELRPHSIQT